MPRRVSTRTRTEHPFFVVFPRSSSARDVHSSPAMMRFARLAPFPLVILGALLAHTTSGSAQTPSPPPPTKIPLDVGDANEPVLQGASIARSPGGARLYVADAPNKSLFVLDAKHLDEGEGSPHLVRVPLPGAPALVVAVGDRVLVTVRDPSMLVAVRAREEGGVVEE